MISGAGTVTKSGAGTLTLTGDNTYTGATTISAGTLSLGNGGTTGSVAGNIVDNAALVFNRSNALTYAGSISGTGDVAKNGAGTLTLTGDSTYTGTTTISAGILSLGNGGTTGSVTGNIVDNAALVFNRSNALTYAGLISGAGTVTKSGTGTLTLTGANTYSGGTTVAGGMLVVDGSLNGAVAVQTSATLAGVGTINGLVTVQNGGTLAPGQSPGTLTLGGLVLAAGSVSRFELNTPGVAGGSGPTGNDLVNVTGNLTLGGTLDIAGAPSAGYYRLFNYGGTLSGSYGTVSAGAFTPTVLTNIANQVNLSLLGAGQQMQFWDGGDQTGNGIVNGGSGTWNSVGTNWTGMPGQAGINDQWRSSVGVFAGSVGGAVTVQGSQTFDTLQFMTDGYTLAGGTLLLGPATGTVNVDGGVAATIGSVIDGAGKSLDKVGTGTLTLTGDNTYTGATTISSGTLSLGNGGTTGSVAGNIVDNAALVFNRSNALTYAGLISGTGTVTKSGAGTLTLTGDNTYTGATTIGAGTLSLGSGGTTGSVAGNIVDNAALVFNRSNALTYAGSISGTGTVTKNGTGTLTLTGDNTYTGTTTISAGTLSLGNGGTTGSVAGNIVDNAALVFNRSDALTYAGMISGTGTVTKSGTGTLTLTGANTYTGTTTISAGTLSIGNGGTTGSVAGNIVDNAALVFNRSDALTYAGLISGTGTLTQAGTGTLTLTGDNTYTGATTISAGTLSLGNGGTTGSVAGDIVDNAALVFNRSNALTYAGLISGTGTVTKSGAGTLTLTGDNTYTGATTISAGTLSLGNGGTTGSVAGNIVDNAALVFNRSNALTYAGLISGTGTVTKNGAGTLTLTGDNTYTGGTTISAGTLSLGSGGTTGSVAGNIVDNAALVFNRSDALTYAGVISGAGTRDQERCWHADLDGNNIYTGGTTISAGTLSLGNGGTTGSVDGNIVDNAALVFNRSDALTYAGMISGTGTLTQAGTGTLTLTGDNTYTGATTISAGTLSLGNGGTTGSVAGNIVDNAALVFNRSNALTYAGSISGTGTVAKNGAGTLTLTGDNTYTGTTTISAGILSLGNGGTTGSVTGNIVDNAALVFNRSNALTYAGVDQRHRHRHQERHRHADADRRQHLHRRHDGRWRNAGRRWQLEWRGRGPDQRHAGGRRHDQRLGHRAEWRHAGPRPEPGHADAGRPGAGRRLGFPLRAQHAGRCRRQRTDRQRPGQRHRQSHFGRHAGHSRRPFGRLLPALQLWRHAVRQLWDSQRRRLHAHRADQHRQSGQSVAARRRAADAVLGRRRPDRQRHRRRRQRNLEQRRHQLDRHAGPGRHQRSMARFGRRVCRKRRRHRHRSGQPDLRYAAVHDRRLHAGGRHPAARSGDRNSERRRRRHRDDRLGHRRRRQKPGQGRHRHADTDRRQHLHRRHDDQQRHALARQWRHDRQRRRQHRRQCCAGLQPQQCADLCRLDQRHRHRHQERRRHTDLDRRQHLHRRHDDRRRHALDRQWRHHRQRRRQHRRRCRAGLQPQQCADLCRLDQRHRHR